MAKKIVFFSSPTAVTAQQEKKWMRMSNPFSHEPTEKQM